jgi:hypothetical protein
MADPLSLAASVSGFLSLTIELTKIIRAYIAAAKSAPQEASELTTELSALSHVLDTLVDILESDDFDVTSSSFDKKSILRSIISASQNHVAAINQKLRKQMQHGKQDKKSKSAASRCVDKIAELAAQMTWLFQRDECREIVQTLHRYVQTLQVLPIASNRYDACPIG